MYENLTDSISQRGEEVPPANKIWAKVIPRTNNNFLVFYLILVFGVDLVIILNIPELISFWAFMLAVFASFGVFYYLENYKFGKKLAVRGQSSLDVWIFVTVVLRNTLLLLNFIPVIQVLGFSLLPTAGLGLLLAYITLVVLRMRN